MTEISKMFENTGIKTKYKLCCTGCKHIAKLEVINGYPSKWICDKYDEVANCDKAELDYPPFTAEKQIELIKFLGSLKDYTVETDKFKGVYYVGCREAGSNNKHWGSHNLFEEALAELVNDLWQDLTDQEKEEIRRILNENG